MGIDRRRLNSPVPYTYLEAYILSCLPAQRTEIQNVTYPYTSERALFQVYGVSLKGMLIT